MLLSHLFWNIVASTKFKMIIYLQKNKVHKLKHKCFCTVLNLMQVKESINHCFLLLLAFNQLCHCDSFLGLGCSERIKWTANLCSNVQTSRFLSAPVGPSDTIHIWVFFPHLTNIKQNKSIYFEVCNSYNLVRFNILPCDFMKKNKIKRSRKKEKHPVLCCTRIV